MGRIAEALKRAEVERAQAHQRNATSVPRVIVDPETADVRSILPDRSMFRAIGRADSNVASEPLLRKGMTTQQLAPTPPWDVHGTVVTAIDRSSIITEEYRAARTWLLRRNTTGKRNAIAVTSSVPKEGKSVTTANLAVVMAEVRHLNVLAIDCDFRQSSLARLYKMPNSPGLSDVLAGRCSLDDAIEATPLGNLSLLPAGTCHDLNPTELLNSRGAAAVFDELRERFHYIFVDTPPVQALSDVGAIGALCTGVVLVVRMNKTAAHLVRQSLHWLQSNKLNVLGCIAADCRAKGSRYEYEDSDEV